MKKPRIAVSSAFLYRKPLETNLRIIRDSGFEWIEFYLTANVLDRKLDDIRDAIGSAGLKTGSIHLPIPFTYNAYWPTLEESIEKGLKWADELRADWVISHPMLVMPDADAELKEAVKRKYRRILFNSSKLDGAGKLLIENMPNLGHGRPIRNLYSYPGEFSEMLDETGFKMTFDPSHWAGFDKDIVEGFRRFEPLVRNIHISDNLDGAEHVMPGEGQLDLDALLREIRSICYSGQVTLELDFTTKGRNEGRDEDGVLDDLRSARKWLETALLGD